MISRTAIVALALTFSACGGDDTDGGGYLDAAVDGPAACMGAQPGGTCMQPGMSCSLEGTGVCDQSPPGGVCTCMEYVWSCTSGCPSGCPGQKPATSASCSLTDGTVCRYRSPSMTSCTCSSGKFSCS